VKAQAFLNLVGKMMTAQQDYYKARKSAKIGSHDLLINAKDLEKQVLAVVREGRLEPDETLDLPKEVRPTETQTNLFQEDEQ